NTIAPAASCKNVRLASFMSAPASRRRLKSSEARFGTPRLSGSDNEVTDFPNWLEAQLCLFLCPMLPTRALQQVGRNLRYSGNHGLSASGGKDRSDASATSAAAAWRDAELCLGHRRQLQPRSAAMAERGPNLGAVAVANWYLGLPLSAL